MSNYSDEFQRYATKHLGMNSLALDQYTKFNSEASRGYVNPTIIEERQLNIAQMDVFSRLMMDRIIFLGSAIDDYVANVIQAQLLFLESSDPGKDISIYINSPGGSVSAGMAIYDTMQYIRSDVSTICIGLAASMGAFLLAAGTPGKRYALPNSDIMIHQPLGGAQGQAADIIIQAEKIKNVRKRMNEILSARTGQTLKKIERDTDRDFYMTAEEAVKYGIVDAVIEKH